MPRQYLVRLLEDGKFPFSKNGKHRRIRVGVTSWTSSVVVTDDLTKMSQAMREYDELSSRTPV